MLHVTVALNVSVSCLGQFLGTLLDLLLDVSAFQVAHVEPHDLVGHEGEPDLELGLPLEDGAAVSSPAIEAIEEIALDPTDALWAINFFPAEVFKFIRRLMCTTLKFSSRTSKVQRLLLSSPSSLASCTGRPLWAQHASCAKFPMTSALSKTIESENKTDEHIFLPFRLPAPSQKRRPPGPLLSRTHSRSATRRIGTRIEKVLHSLIVEWFVLAYSIAVG